jgi:hypothetical protein
MDRRELLRVLAAGAGVSRELLAWGRWLHAQALAGAAGGRGMRALGAHEAATVTAAAERIIPRSDTPGATDAGVTAFIDHMLAHWYDPRDRDRVLAGLAGLDARSRALGGRDFVALAEREQEALLAAIDGEASSHDHWFATLKFLTVWGYCTSEVAVREIFGAYPLPMRYEACAPYAPRAGS